MKQAKFKIMAIVVAVLVGGAAMLSCTKGDNAKATIKGEEIAVLTAPPNVPPPITRKHNTKLIVNLEVIEQNMEITKGVEYPFWTFGGTVPGSFIRIKEGDEVEFHLKNHPSSKMPHNIDLHAVTGPGGGAAASFTLPGYESVFSFKALNPGLYVYHCATAPVGMHIANGMYGLILVEPKEGLPKVDREYYVMQGDFYTKGAYGKQGFQPFDMEKAIDEKPTYVVFNGSVEALLHDNALKAEVGETVRLFVGNGGPNLVSSFHVIGEILDRVYVEGGTKINKNVQTTLVPAGGATIAEFKVEVPGELVLVDHSIFRAFNKGALGTLSVTGGENKTVFTGKTAENVYLPEGSAVQTMPMEKEIVTEATSLEERLKLGKNTYVQTCAACHQIDGKGIPGAFPPLVQADWLNADVARSISAVKNGLSGEITVNGEKYNSVMPSLGLTDEAVANVLTYVYHNFGNDKHTVTPEMVRKVPKGPPIGSQ